MKKEKTTLTHGGCNVTNHTEQVSPPLYRSSTVLYDSVAEIEKSFNDPLHNQKKEYGRFGSPNTNDLDEVLCELENGYKCVFTTSD